MENISVTFEKASIESLSLIMEWLKWKAHLSTTGKTISIDYFIGNENFLGKGLAAITLKLFIRFFSAVIDPQADTYLIDPDIDNQKARHVYARAGFISIGRYKVDTGTFKGREKDLMVLKIYGSPKSLTG